ncbi:MAG TPA: HEAT repeat domain-containing protein [Longimicrobium sp.]|nr:HEAT repeat domain-containing protein [Longimicrobium sp.]
MPPRPRSRAPTRPVRLLAAAAALVLLAGCGGLLRRTPPPPPSGFPRLLYEARRVLDVEEPSPAYFRDRARLEVMGRELDEVLITLATDASEEAFVRVNALTLLADRRAPVATEVLRRILVTSGDDGVRAAAVTALSAFAADSPQVRVALRAALGDPAARVRLGALQRLDVADAAAIRELLPQEDNPQVRLIARQLLTVFEARGAPLVRDARGDFRTTGADTVPIIVFHPTRRDTLGDVYVGALWVELPGAQLVPLSQQVEVVDGVVPAFFDPARTAVVYEADRRIHVRDLRTGRTRSVGTGIAPRLIPLSDRFVYVREVPGSRRPAPGGTSVEYLVLRAPFADGEVERIGTLRAVFRPERFHGASPARTMVVAETSGGFGLRGADLTPFDLPGDVSAPRP